MRPTGSPSPRPKNQHESHQRPGPTPPVAKPSRRAHAVNAPYTHESAWSVIFELKATTIPQHQPLLQLTQAQRRRPPQPLITTSSMPRRPRSLTSSSLLHTLRR
ncbi:unnamed protein product [Schistocephalus solidus]|uniref:Uncharacterized protein n=1 Tax=Schistocephalus solidus TaxID=70667 RepID=A0A183TH71_SCHSO|nr:unnamed protein product [Schistocephalus solidus]